MSQHRLPSLEAGPKDAERAAILVHGRGGSAEDMMGLAQSLGLHDRRVICPQATGHSWYPARFIAPLEQNQPWLDDALARLEDEVSTLLETGFAVGDILLIGFSQGACLTSEYLARHPRRYEGAMIFTGGLIGPPGTIWPVSTALADVPVFLSTSETDGWVPPSRVRETDAWLKACGARSSLVIYEDRPHTIIQAELAAAKQAVGL